MVQPKAFIFDLDGVITDTAEYHYLAWKNLAEKLSIKIDRAFNENLKGVSRMESFNRILAYGNKEDLYTKEEKEAFATEKNEAYKELINLIAPKDVLPNIMELLDLLKANNIKIGLASASKNAFKVIEKLEVGDYFDYIANAKYIKNSKPAPDVFLNVMEHFGLKSYECIGVEDAEAGIEAIHRANMFAVGIGSVKDLKESDILFKSTADIAYNAIIESYNQYLQKIK